VPDDGGDLVVGGVGGGDEGQGVVGLVEEFDGGRWGGGARCVGCCWLRCGCGRGCWCGRGAAAEGETERQRRGAIPARGKAPRTLAAEVGGLKARSIIFPMPRSLSFVLVHVIFSTKDRLPLLDDAVQPALHAYLATVTRNADCECYRVGGVADHVHLAVRLNRTVTVAKLVADLKTLSSKWLKSQSPRLSKFAWQEGYGAFSVGPADLDKLLHYIDTQEAHHRKQSFQDEFRAFLKKYGMDGDEQYLWD